MAFPTYPAITFRNMRQSLVQSPAFELSDTAAHPFAPTGWGDPAAPAAPAAPNANAGTYAPGSFGAQAANANRGLYAPGSFGASNAVANGTGAALPSRFNDPASGPGLRANPVPAVYDEAQYNGVGGVGRPVAAPARASALLVQGMKNVTPGGGRQYDLTGRGAPDPVLTAAGGPSPEALAYQRLFPSAGAPPAPISTGGLNGNLVSLAGSAAGLQDEQAAVAADRTLKLLSRAGALPVAGDSPESSANKFGYLNSRLATTLNGGTPRAPGSPAMDGAPVLPARYGGAPGQVTTGDAANLYRALQTSSQQPRYIEDPVSGERKLIYNGRVEASGTNPSMKPGEPGSRGFTTTDIPGAGKLVKDNASGKFLGSGDFSKVSDPKDKILSDAETQNVQALQQSKRDLDTMEAAYKELKDPDYGGPIAGRVRSAVSLGSDPNIARLNNLVTAATPNLARGVFRERGVLTDADVARYQKLLPNVNDTAAQRTQKFADLRSRLEASTKETLATLEASGRDVADLRTHIMGPAPVAGAPNNSAPNNPVKLPPGSITAEQARAEIARRRAAKK